MCVCVCVCVCLCACVCVLFTRHSTYEETYKQFRLSIRDFGEKYFSAGQILFTDVNYSVTTRVPRDFAIFRK